MTCKYRNADVIVSLDAPIGEEDDDLILMDTIADESVAVSELASDRIVLEQLFKRLADLMPEAENIGKLRMQGLPDEAIAKVISVTTPSCPPATGPRFPANGMCGKSPFLMVTPADPTLSWKAKVSLHGCTAALTIFIFVQGWLFLRTVAAGPVSSAAVCSAA